MAEVTPQNCISVCSKSWHLFSAELWYFSAQVFLLRICLKVRNLLRSFCRYFLIWWIGIFKTTSVAKLKENSAMITKVKRLIQKLTLTITFLIYFLVIFMIFIVGFNAIIWNIIQDWCLSRNKCRFWTAKRLLEQIIKIFLASSACSCVIFSCFALNYLL